LLTYPDIVPAFDRILRSLTVFALALPLAALAATPITGVVTNRTTNKPAAGDTVVLIRLAQGMQESTHTTTDARGHFTLEVPDEGLHLVRVTHDKATYFHPVQPGVTTADIDVYSSAPTVKGVTTEAIVMRIETDATGTNLRVVENIFIKNESNPPTTQFSNEPFDFYLPAGAIVEGAAALAPGGMPLKVAPVPLGEAGKYTFLFPIRPGGNDETRFQVSYHMPYTGSFHLDAKIAGPTGTIALMLPKSMSVKLAPSSPFGAVNDEVDAQTYVAQNVTPSQPLGVDISGKGELPRDTQNPDAGTQSAAPAPGGGGTIAATDNTAPGKGLDNPLDPNGDREPVSSKYKWWILAGLTFLLAIAAGVLLRKPATPSPAIAAAPITPVPVAPIASQHSLLLQALKEELFTLETERLQGHISELDYSEQKAALELILRRALARPSSAVV
jgi:hypothetical protein